MTDPDALFLLGMVAYLTGVVQAPITAFVIVTEMANAHGMIIPLMATAVVSKQFAPHLPEGHLPRLWRRVSCLADLRGNSCYRRL